MGGLRQVPSGALTGGVGWGLLSLRTSLYNYLVLQICADKNKN